MKSRPKHGLAFSSLILLALALATVIADRCKNVSVSENDLIQHIFANYSKDGRPKRNASQPVSVAVGLRLSSIVKFNEKSNALILTGYVYLDWEDEFLTWASTFPYNCVEYLLLKKEDVWSPDLLILNAEDAYSLVVAAGNKVWLSKTGFSQFTPAFQMAVMCEPDLALFPFDKQICSIRIESWNYPTTYQSLHLQKPAFMKIANSWTENKQWELIGHSAHVYSYESSDGSTYDTVVFKLLIKRRTLFYFVNIIIPSLILGVVELVNFVLPIEDVIRVHISFTCLVAYSIFQSMILADLPRSSDTVPLLSMYINLQMAYIALIAILGEGIVFMFVKRAKNRMEKPPRNLFKAFRCVGQLFCVDYDFILPAVALLPEHLHFNASEMAKRRRSLKVLGYEDQQEIRKMWLYLAEVVERLNMIVYITAMVATPAIMFYALPPDKTIENL